MDRSNDKAKFSEKYPNESGRQIWLAGSVLGYRRHVCAFFSGRDEEYQVLLPFVRDGLERGEKVVHTVDPERRGEHFARLEAGGNCRRHFLLHGGSVAKDKDTFRPSHGSRTPALAPGDYLRDKPSFPRRGSP
jgi:hypothetical protein